MLKNKLILAFFSVALFTPAYAVLDEDISHSQIANSVEQSSISEQKSDIAQEQAVTDNSESINEELINEAQLTQEKSTDNNLITNQYKRPVSKRKIIKKFLFAMSGVIVSSLLIFFVLSIYNRIRQRFGNMEQFFETNEDKSLETPNDIFEAVNKFIDKTKWE